MTAPLKAVYGIIFTIGIVASTFANSPVTFVPNEGQWTGPFQFKSEFYNLAVFAESQGFTYVLGEEIHYHHDHDDDHAFPETIQKHAFRLRFANANNLSFEGVNQKSGYHNYIIGSDRNNWKGHVPVYSELSADELYPGIGVRAYGESGSFKYDFIIEPGSDASQILFSYTGTDGVEVSKDQLLIRTSVGDVYESIPVSYQIIDGIRVEIACRYKQFKDGIGFVFPKGYDENYELVIDPVLVAATLSGTTSGGSNYGHGATYDLQGNIYTHAISFNSGYPTEEGSFQESFGGGGTDAAISKLTPDGSDLIFATFLGGNQGEYPHSTIVNGNGEIYVFGITGSSDYPTSLSGFQTSFGGGSDDIFITGLTADGSALVGSTYLGGSGNDGRNSLTGGYDNYRGEINTNIQGEIFLASCSSSENFPTTEGSFQPDKKTGQDGVVLKMNGDLSDLVWSTFIGSDVDDMAYGIRIRDDQTVFVSGAVGGNGLGGEGTGFVTTAGAHQETYGGGINDGFISHLTEDGTALISSTFIGLEASDRCFFMDVDSEGDVWVYMSTGSDWEVTDGAWGTGSGNIVVNKLSGDLSSLLITSYLTNQGMGNGTPVAFMVDLCNGIYISAYGVGNQFVASDDALFDEGGFYLGVFTPDMADLEYGTYYTGNHVDGGTSRFDKQGIVYQGVCSCGVFNTTDDAWATDQSTGCDIGVFKIDFEITSVNAVAGAIGQVAGCAPHTVSFNNFSMGDDYIWNFGDDNTSLEFEPTHLYEEPGEYLVTLVVNDPESCNLTDTAFIPITVYEDIEFITQFDYELDCETGEIIIINQSQGPGDLEYIWDMGDGTILSGDPPVHLYDEPGSYTVVLSLTSEACSHEGEYELEVFYQPEVIADFDVGVLDICDSYLVGVANLSASANQFEWDMGDGNTETGSGVFEYEYAEPGTYDITLIASNPVSCNIADTMTLSITLDPTPMLNPVITSGQTGFCEDLEFFAEVEIDGVYSSIAWVIEGDTIENNTPQLSGNVTEEGLQSITVVVTDPLCNHVFTDQVDQMFYEYLGFELPNNTYLCYYEEELTLDATVPFTEATYSWTPSGSEDSQLVVTIPDTYEVTVGYNGCIEVQDSDVNPGNEFDLAFEELICAGYPNTILFTPDVNIIESVTWENGSTGFQTEVSEPGYYPFIAVDIFGCDQVDSLNAVPRDDDPNIQIPNIFTPNADGFNDVFEMQGDELVYFQLEIYDRWGLKVFETDDIYGTWDGVIERNDKASEDNTFFYTLKYRDYCDREDQVLSGNLTLIR